MTIIVIDNYDSFTYNLVQLFGQFPVTIEVYRNDEIGINQIEDMNPSGIIISPGPKTPGESGICKGLVRRLGKRCPILGVCLGMQIINEVFGGTTMLAPRPVHGERDLIFHKDQGILSGLSNPFRAARYHSLTVKKNSSEIITTAWNKDGLIMGIQHSDYAIFGVQFHPESFMTEGGSKLAANFLHFLGYARE